MNTLRYTLLGEGSSDEALLHHIEWIFQRYTRRILLSEYARLDRLPRPPKTFPDRIARTITMYPCDILFIHRDADRQTYDKRFLEITESVQAACEGNQIQNLMPMHICVIPVRMLEAWLLFDEAALRRTAGRPRGKEPLDLPSLKDIENLPNPKEILNHALNIAATTRSDRARGLHRSEMTLRLAELIDDFSPLLALSAFARLNRDIHDVVRAHHWEG
jgi:hypothetical protein